LFLLKLILIKNKIIVEDKNIKNLLIRLI